MNRDLKNLLLWLLLGSRGGPTRTRILLLIKEKPMNVHQIAKELHLNYRTVKYHVNILMEHGIVERIGDDYGAVYVTSEIVDKNWEEIEKMLRGGVT